MGKKIITAAIKTLLAMPYPSHTTRRGATAKTGIAWDATRKGAIAFSIDGYANMTMERGTATAREISIPARISSAVTPAWGNRSGARKIAIFKMLTGAGKIKSGIFKLRHNNSHTARITKATEDAIKLDRFIFYIFL